MALNKQGYWQKAGEGESVVRQGYVKLILDYKSKISVDVLYLKNRPGHYSSILSPVAVFIQHHFRDRPEYLTLGQVASNLQLQPPMDVGCEERPAARHATHTWPLSFTNIDVTINTTPIIGLHVTLSIRFTTVSSFLVIFVSFPALVEKQTL